MVERDRTIEGASAVSRVAVDDDWLVFDPEHKRAHLLNRTAALVLDAVVACGSGPVDDVVVTCAQAAGTSPDEVRADVEAAIDALASEGLIRWEGAPASAVPPDAPLVTDEPFVAEDLPHRTRRFRGIETSFTVATDDAVLTNQLDRLLGGLAVDADGAGHRYAVTVEGTTATIALDDRVVTRVTHGPTVLQYLLWHIDRLIVANTSQHLLLHAGAVVGGDGAVVLAGVMNSGKSTLTAALVREGFPFVTDEMVAVHLTDHLVTPFPRPITLESGSWPLFEATAHPAADAPGASRRYLEPTDEPVDRAPVARLVFPEYVRGSTLALIPVTPAAAALELASHTFVLDGDGLRAIAHLVHEVPAVRLRHPGIDVAVPALRAWLRDA